MLDAKGLDAYLDRLYAQEGPKIDGGSPYLHDIYEEAGVQPSRGHHNFRNGETCRHTLGRALASGYPIVQVVTWNDFGEGIRIEPSGEYGYRHLEAVQGAPRRSRDDPCS